LYLLAETNVKERACKREQKLKADSSPAMRTNFPGTSNFNKPLDFIGDFAVFVFIIRFGLFKISNPVYHTEHCLASKNTLPVRTEVRTKTTSGLVRVGLGLNWG